MSMAYEVPASENGFMRILFLGKTFPSSREHLRAVLPDDEITDATPREAKAIGLRAEVVIPTMCRVDSGLMDAVKPRLIQQFGVGLEGVDLDAARAREIAVANVPAAETGNASSVAELALLHLLVLFRRYGEARQAVGAGRLGEPIGEALSGKSAVLVGLGAVGQEVAARLHALGFKVIAVGRTSLAPGAPLPRNVDAHYSAAELTTALAQADCTVVCAALTPATRGLIGAPQIDSMPKGSFLVNVARGPVVEYEALLAALRSGHLGGAGLDVFWDEPIDPSDPLLRENVSVTPHVGGVTVSSYRAIAHAIAENVEHLRRGEPVRNRHA